MEIRAVDLIRQWTTTRLRSEFSQRTPFATTRSPSCGQNTADFAVAPSVCYAEQMRLIKRRVRHSL